MVLSNNRANFRSMKKYLLLLLCVVALGGCKLDEAGFPKEGEVSLIGKWYNKKTDTSGGVITVNSNYTSSDYLLFGTNTVTFSMTGFGTITSKYVKNGSTLTVTSSADATDIDNYTISKLTTDSLVLVSNSTVTVNGGTPIVTITTDRYARK